MTTNVKSQTECSSNRSLTTASEFYSLLDAVDSEFIADQFDIGTYTNKHDFENHLKVGVFEGINPSASLAELAEKTASHDQLEEIAGSIFSRHTNDRAVVAVVRVFFELLHSPQLYHQRSVQRKRFEWLDRTVVAIDGANLALTRSVAVASELHDGEVIDEIKPGDRGLKFNLAARVDGHAKGLLPQAKHVNQHSSSISKTMSKSSQTSTRRFACSIVAISTMTASARWKSVRRTSCVCCSPILGSMSWSESRTSTSLTR